MPQAAPMVSRLSDPSAGRDPWTIAWLYMPDPWVDNVPPQIIVTGHDDYGTPVEEIRDDYGTPDGETDGVEDDLWKEYENHEEEKGEVNKQTIYISHCCAQQICTQRVSALP